MESIKEEKPNTEEAAVKPEKKAGGFNVKILLFGLPVFIVQLVAVYFITANILLSRIQSNHTAVEQTPAQTKPAATEQAKPKELGKFIYVPDDLIINPANTDGKRLLLASLGFDVPSDKDQQELKAKDVLLRDAVISVMSSKSLDQLSSITYRDTLRMEITKRLASVVPDVKINTIYFSKYILQ